MCSSGPSEVQIVVVKNSQCISFWHARVCTVSTTCPLSISSSKFLMLDVYVHCLSNCITKRRFPCKKLPPQRLFLARRQALQSASQLERPLLLQATFEGFQRNGIDEKGAEKLMRLSVQLACEVRAGFRALCKINLLKMRWYKLLVFQGA